jgi:molybdate transport system substrate-binding protein
VRILLVVVALLAGCGGGGAREQVTVFAASSLTEPFTSLTAQYERENPGVDVVLNFAGSSDLVAQLEQGARADVLATADPTTMARAEQSLGLTADQFARNTMAIAVPADNPGDVRDLADLDNPDLRTVVCAPQVPCGIATERVQRNAGLTIPAVSEEASVADVLGKVRSGEADAGVVYASDLVTAGEGVRGIAIPAQVNAENAYLISAVTPQGADFVDLVRSTAGRQVLRSDGFLSP